MSFVDPYKRTAENIYIVWKELKTDPRNLEIPTFLALVDLIGMDYKEQQKAHKKAMKRKK